MLRKIIALCLICILALPFLVYALGIQARSPGALFFRQPRVGKGGRVFLMWKLRTMVPRAEDELQRLIERDPAVAAEWASFGRLKNDPRIAGSLGRWAVGPANSVSTSCRSC